jgi:5-methylcytosine-specific restriction endonuclease McrA
MWDPTNHQSLCQTCHDIKSETERTGASLRP